MSPTAQREFVTQLCDSIRDRVLERIDDMDIPEEWDGIELRQLLAEMFMHERGFRFGRVNSNYHPTSKRYRDYRNDVLIANLDR